MSYPECFYGPDGTYGCKAKVEGFLSSATNTPVDNANKTVKTSQHIIQQAQTALQSAQGTISRVGPLLQLSK